MHLLELDHEVELVSEVGLLDEVVDWEPAIQGNSTDDWDRAHPGLPVDRWGLE
jgi:hypothetical protein